MNTPRSNVQAAVERIRGALGTEACLVVPEDIAPYLEDFRQLYRGRTPLVVCPATSADVALILGICHKYGVGVVPHGGNTSYCGGATPSDSSEEIVLALRRLNRIRELDAANFSITVEAGCLLADVQAAAESADRFFPLALGSEGSCQIGGNLSTNAGGLAAVRYGVTRDLVLGLEVVLPDGRLLDGLTSLRKDNTGFDLRDLFIGAEGTLGVITAASLKLFPRPRTVETALIAVPAVSVIAGVSTVVVAVRHADSLVADDWYKRGLAINVDLERERLAAELGFSAALWVDASGQEVRVALDGGATDAERTLVLELHHPTQARRDTVLHLVRGPDGSFRGTAPADVRGRWHASLAPDHATWSLAGTFSLTPGAPSRLVPRS